MLLNCLISRTICEMLSCGATCYYNMFSIIMLLNGTMYLYNYTYTYITWILNLYMSLRYATCMLYLQHACNMHVEKMTCTLNEYNIHTNMHISTTLAYHACYMHVSQNMHVIARNMHVTCTLFGIGPLES